MERRLAELNSEDNKLIKQELIEAKVRLHRKLIDDLNLPMVERLSKEELRAQVSEIVTDYVRSERISAERPRAGELSPARSSTS